MGYLKIASSSPNGFVVELYQWNGQEHVCIGQFEIRAVDNQIDISAAQDWRTHHRNDIELSYFSNEPMFHLENLGKLGESSAMQDRYVVEPWREAGYFPRLLRRRMM